MVTHFSKLFTAASPPPPPPRPLLSLPSNMLEINKPPGGLIEDNVRLDFWVLISQSYHLKTIPFCKLKQIKINKHANITINN